MDIKISGKNIETGAAFQRHAEDALQDVVNKYFANAIAAAVTLEKTLAGFTVKTKVNLNEEKIIFESLSTNKNGSFYTKNGDIFAIIISVISLIVISFKCRKYLY